MSGEEIEDMNKTLGELEISEVKFPIKKSAKQLTPEEIALRQKEMRKNIALELLSTEETYVQALEVVGEEFIATLKKDADSFAQSSILPKDHVKIIFANWEVCLCLLSFLPQCYHIHSYFIQI